MEINGKLTKQILETKYLNVENTNRYRPIMRIFFEHYEKLDYWLYKEQVYNELKDNIDFANYSLELCEQDLNQLVLWQSLTYFQDTDNVLTIDEFKNKKFRYQMTDYAIEIERFVMRLESLQVKRSSLEPKLFEKIRMLIINLEKEEDISNIHDYFEELNYNFTTLNEHYKDFLKTFNEAKTEDLMKTAEFLAYKNSIVKYLNDFVVGFQNYNLKIVDLLDNLPNNFEQKLMDSLIAYQKNIPNLEPNFDFDYLREINLGKWHSIIHWFKNDSGISESMRLKNAINDIISKILKNVSAIMELKQNSINRKEEYRHLLAMFCNSKSLRESENIAAVAFGISSIKHFSKIQKQTDDIGIDALLLDPLWIEVKSHSRKIKENITKRAIVDKTLAKQEQLEAILAIRKREQEILNQYIKNGFIELKNLEKISQFERRFILSLISNGINKNKYVNDSEHGVKYIVVKNSDEYIDLISDDGVFHMPDLKIVFGDRNE